MTRPYLSIVIPCYNEAENLRQGVLEEVLRYLETKKFSWEVIISDDGSADESTRLVEDFVKKHPGFRLLKNPHGGKPFAVRAGIKKARGDIILFTDMDQSTPLDQVEKLLPWFEKGYKVVIGSRGRKRKDFPFYRLLASNIFRLLRRLFLLREIVDTQCGFKAFKKEAALRIFSKMEIFKRGAKAKGWRVTAFDVEVLFLAQKLGYKIKEIEVSWMDRDVARGKGRKFLKESGDMAKEILRVKLNDWQGKYE